MSAKEYVSKSVELITPLIQSQGLELVDIEFVKERGDYYLRVYAQKEGGIGILDCEKLSRAFSDVLDREDFISEEYILEVSSPGDHPFKSDRDYERNLGGYVRIRTYEPIDGLKSICGDLSAFDDQTVSVTVDDKTIIIPRNKIAKANADFKL